MKFLITNDTSFIDPDLAEKQLNEGSDTIRLGNLHTGSEADIAHLKDRKGFEPCIHSVRGQSLVIELTEQ